MSSKAEQTGDHNSWVEISRKAIANNVNVFRKLAGDTRNLMAVVKANAYGHGMVPVAEIALETGANWLGVFDAHEGLELREAGIRAPVLVLGPTPDGLLKDAISSNLSVTLTSMDGVRTLCAHSERTSARVHLKLETGTNRQGLVEGELFVASRLLKDAGVTVEGAYTHFADIEDTTDHEFAMLQLERFEQLLETLRSQGVHVDIPHTACTAAAILFPQTYFEMVRVGIGLYGLWPSKETQVSAQDVDRNALGLAPAMTWKTRLSQIKNVPAGGYVGYGRTFRTTRATRIGVLPVGYVDGYDRKLSNGSYTLVRGTRAPVLGRVCMNLTMIDVTDVPNATPGDEVILLGREGDEVINAEQMARLAGTINYEIVSRVAPQAPRILV